MKKGEKVIIEGYPDEEFEVLHVGRKMLRIRGDFSGVGHIQEGGEFKTKVVKVITKEELILRKAIVISGLANKLTARELKQNLFMQLSNDLAEHIRTLYKKYDHARKERNNSPG